MDIRVFKTFIEVAENKHFGRAAETLYITPAAVSARIKQLEEFYATQLIIREKNNLRLTPSGEALLSHAHLMISQMEQSKVALSIANQQKISFNIAATPNVWDAFFSNRIHDAIELFDNVSLSTEISVREAIQRKLDDRSLDVGLLMDPIKDNEFTNELIGHFDLSLIGSHANYDRDVEDYILVDWGITFQKEHALHHKVIPSFKTSTAMIALEVILSKGGFAYLPTELITDHLTSQELFEIEAPVQIKRPIFMVYRNNNATNELITQFKNLLLRIQ
ncbi:LysR family transcriptional regulator [Psychrobium sp. 1_MG-2023]|uniref:LysR family transcriptional regulator n=1 Tax=Psychrobium sp. 1_MG-2023 TaxID=3062624 RepID=UPI000C33FCE8|nr:LysR family transcriptional regulator [Psychrobium sp. 1_MG-2023]MDP2561390.1 LysR family transcriptional regulator [Psychrobium sp. 1_MG-2023]PKF54870.1 LysR family transcriptional regulator [Alteromonadales bacterium alter-6D02]